MHPDLDRGSPPGAARRTDHDRAGALGWTTVLEGEFEALYGARPFDHHPPDDPDIRLRELHRRLHERRPAGLCLSGGGIRSATFGLGVVQALARVGVLGKLDYLSTVSGGGYVGSWLTSWLHREGRGDVLRGLDPSASAAAGAGAPPSPVDRLRATCRYLAPAGGFVSADVWTLIMTLARNLMLNWLVLLPLIAAALLVPRIYMASVALVERNVLAPPGGPCLPADAAPFWLALVSLSMFVVAIGYVVMSFVGRGDSWPQGRFLAFVVVPTVVGAIALTLFWSAYPCSPDEAAALFVSAVLPAAGWLVIGAFARPRWGTAVPAGIAAVLTGVALAQAGRWSPENPSHLLVLAGLPLLLVGVAALNGLQDGRAAPANDRAVRMTAGARTVIAALVAGPIVGLGTYWFAREYFYFGDPLGETYAVFAVPGILALILVANTAFIGLASKELSDAALEWWSRFSAWLAIAATLWLTAGVLVFYLADLVELAVQSASTAFALEHHTSSALMTVLVPLVSSLAGLAARGGGASGRPSALRLATHRLMLPATIVALLAAMAWFNAWALRGFEPPGAASTDAGLGETAFLATFLLLLGLLVSRFVPVNRFSLHGMYRQRLVRTFLGASHMDRQPNAFTGFDPADDLRMHDLVNVRPLHVINTTLNNLSATNYGRTERRADAFTFSPLHVGCPVLGYRRSSEYGSDGGGPATGLSLGMAVAVSGAAASPAMGMFSSSARAFLLTLANARLGLWFGNPSDEVTWQRSEPALGVGPIARELLGLETERNPYIYLSDGGHFENLGLWSLVVRRCGVIIVSDAGCDPDFTFADLSNAIRRIRIDLGIPIEIATSEVARAVPGSSRAHAALGTIRYSAVDGPGAPDGLLLYVKATLTGDEPVDVANFAALDPTFPHDSTANQFFDEDRFESYRALGYHSVLSFAGGLKDADAWDLCAAAVSGERAVSPPEAVAGAAAPHGYGPVPPELPGKK